VFVKEITPLCGAARAVGAYSIMFFSFYPVDYVKKLKLAAIVAAVK
jgi:hypothetical protein